MDSGKGGSSSVVEHPTAGGFVHAHSCDPAPWLCTAALEAETTISEMMNLRLGEIHNLPQEREPTSARTGI